MQKIGVNKTSPAKGFGVANLQAASDVSSNLRFFYPLQLYFVDYCVSRVLKSQ
jgi:hypothetical protein